jgi:hypothetical protein
VPCGDGTGRGRARRYLIDLLLEPKVIIGRLYAGFFDLALL